MESGEKPRHPLEDMAGRGQSSRPLLQLGAASPRGQVQTPTSAGPAKQVVPFGHAELHAVQCEELVFFTQVLLQIFSPALQGVRRQWQACKGKNREFGCDLPGLHPHVPELDTGDG
jgi:hypothetical protein